MTREEQKIALHCLKAYSDYHSEVCEECINYPNCDHTMQDDVIETIIKELEQELILDKIRAEIEDLAEADAYGDYQMGFSCGLWKAVEIIDKYKAESEGKK